MVRFVILVIVVGFLFLTILAKHDVWQCSEYTSDNIKLD